MDDPERKERTRFLEFKDANGNTVSVAKKTEVEDRSGKFTVFLVADPDQTVTIIDESRFNEELNKTKEEIAKNEEDKKLAKGKVKKIKEIAKDPVLENQTKLKT